MERNEYFSFSKEIANFDQAIAELVGKLTEQERAKFISPENVMRFSHGNSWVTVSSDNSDEESNIEAYTAELIINFHDLRDHNLKVLPIFIKDTVRTMDRSVQSSMFQMISDASDKSGNTINGNDFENSADAFLASMKGIQFGVDRDGKVSMPQAHLAPQAFAKLKKDAEIKGQKFEEEMNEVIKQKTEEALERERQRLDRFDRK